MTLPTIWKKLDKMVAFVCRMTGPENGRRKGGTEESKEKEELVTFLQLRLSPQLKAIQKVVSGLNDTS